MLSFISEELVWAMGREREEEARRVRPHTERRQASQDSGSGPPSRGEGSPLFELRPYPSAR